MHVLCPLIFQAQKKHALLIVMTCKQLFVFLLYVKLFVPIRSKKDILFILADDLGYNDIGYNNKKILTPNINKLYKESTPLKNYYVQPICTPTRSTLMTGRSQIHIGLQHGYIKLRQPNSIPLDEKLLSNYFQDCGFETNLVGKWHNGFYTEKATPRFRGFDNFLGYLGGSEGYYDKARCDVISGKYTCGIDFQINGIYSNSTFGKYSAEVYVEALSKYYRNRNKNKAKGSSNKRPSFTLLAFQSIHTPHEVPEKFLRPYDYVKNNDRKKTMAMITALDYNIGKLLENIDLNNTIIIFSSDNGGQTSTGGNNWPFRGKKTTYFEGGIKVPGFIYPKGLLTKTNHLEQKLFHISDWLPTLLSISNCYPKNGQFKKKLDGVDQTKTERSELLYNIDPLHFSKKFTPNSTEEEMSVRSDFDVRVKASYRLNNFKIITGPCMMTKRVPPPEGQSDTLRFEPNQHKITDTDGNLRLYNVVKDPYEFNNLATERPDLTLLLLRKLADFNQTAVKCNYPDEDIVYPRDGFWKPWKHLDDNFL